MYKYSTCTPPLPCCYRTIHGRALLCLACGVNAVQHYMCEVSLQLLHSLCSVVDTSQIIFDICSLGELTTERQSAEYNHRLVVWQRTSLNSSPRKPAIKMLFVRPSVRKAREAAAAAEAQIAEVAVLSPPTYYSDVVASHKSTHPDVLPIKQILETTELCEWVLKYLPLKDLFYIWGLCRATRHCVDHSPTLQTKLFFKVAPSSQPWLLDIPGCTILAGSKASERIDEAKSAGAPPPRTTTVHIYNELLLQRDVGKGHSANGFIIPTHIVQYTTSGMLGSYPRNLRLRLAMKDLLALPQAASCRDMFITHPPVAFARITVLPERVLRGCYWQRELNLSESTSLRVTEPGGLTLGHLADAAVEHLSAYENDVLGTLEIFPSLIVSAEQHAFVEGLGQASIYEYPWCGEELEAKKRREREERENILEEV